MVTELLSANEDIFCASFLITPENVLVDNGQLTEAGLIENIAQTAAAGAGHLAGLKNEPVKAGYIGSIANLEIFALPQIGDVLNTQVTITDKVFDVNIIAGSVTCNGKLLATCEMKIFINNAAK